NQLVIYSGATLDITGNDFRGIGIGGNGIVAQGDPSATIDLRNNYWGTTDLAQIKDRILKDSTPRPTVLYDPPLTAPPTLTLAASATATFNIAQQPIILQATVNGSGGPVNDGFVTFTILNGT